MRTGSRPRSSHARSRLHEPEGPRIPRPAGRWARSGAALRVDRRRRAFPRLAFSIQIRKRRPSALGETATRTPHPLPMQVLQGQAVSPGIAIGPVVVLDPRGLRLPPALDHGRRRSPPNWSGSTAGWTPRTSAAGQDETEARTRLGPQYADILAAHCRMIADPTLRADARKIIEQRARLRRARRRSMCSRSLSPRLERLSGSHLSARAADVRDIEARILSHLIGELPQSFQDELAGAGDLAGARPDPQRSGGARPRARPGLRHRGRRPCQPHRDRRGRPGDPGRGGAGQVPGPCPALPHGHHRRRRGPGHPRPRPGNPGALSQDRRRAIGAGFRSSRGRPTCPPRPTTARDRALGQYRVRRRSRGLPRIAGPPASGCSAPSSCS